MSHNRLLTSPDISRFRARFPILAQKTYLYNCSQGALSDAVEGAMRAYAESWRTSSDPWGEWIGSYETLRATFARLVNAHPDEIAILTSASAGINPIANALTFGARNRVVMGEYEFPTMGHIWLAQQPRGAQIQFLLGAGGAIPTEFYEAAVDERTLVVPLTHVSFLNGYRSDVSSIVRMAHEKGALVFLDGYQDCGTRHIDVKALDVDFYVTGALKYLLGPSGIAFLYVRRELIESLTPTMTSWMSQRDVFAFNTQRLDPAPTARRFETGTPAIPNIFMAQAALDLLLDFGLENAAHAIEDLTRAFQERVRNELRIQSKTPESSVGPLVVLRSTDAPAMVARLTARGIVTSARHDGVRFAFHAYNTSEDVEAAVKALADNLDLMVQV